MKSLLVVLLAMLTVFALPAAAQTLPEMVPVKPEEKEPAVSPVSPPADPLFVESIEVRVVELEVFVTDKDGNPVTGLTRDDFELKVDGKPATISNFYAVEGGEVARPAEAPAAEGEEQVAAPPMPKEQPLHLVIYIDNFNIHPFNRKKVLRALKNFLRVELQEDDRVMMVTYDRSLTIDNTFTTDHERIISTINEIDEKGGERVFYEQDRRDLLNEIAEAEVPGRLLSRIENHSEGLMNELKFTLDALGEMVGYLSGIEGRKALLYVSDGLPMKAGEELFYAYEEKWERSTAMLRSLDFNALRRFEEVTMAANANQVTLYTIDAVGQRQMSGMDVRDRDRGFSSHIDGVTTANMQASLNFMSRDTGGVAVTNTNNISGGLERIAHDFNSYYSIGFQPGHAGDGQFHRTSVKVTRDGVKVRQRRGYRDQPAAKQMEDGTISSLVLGYQDNRMGIKLGTGLQMPYEDEGNYLVPVEVRIPLGQLTLLNRGGKHQGRVLITVAARQDNGDLSPVQEHVVPITIPEADWETAQHQVYTYEMNLVMAPGVQRMSVGVKDELSAEISYLARTIRVGPKE